MRLYFNRASPSEEQNFNRASPSEEQIREDLAHARKVEATRVVGEKFAKLKSHYEAKYGSFKPAAGQSRAQLGIQKPFCDA